MIDGLYLAGQWVAEVSPALTYQSNDLQKPDTIQSSYSLQFTLPDTLSIRRLTESAEQPESGGVYPYKALPARLIQNGELIFYGIARLASFQNGWSVTLGQLARSLYDQLADLKLQDLDLSRYDHPWTRESISQFAGKANGVTYPLIDYGTFDGTKFAQDTLFPAVYVGTILTQALRVCGYRPAGDWLTEPLLARLALPFVADQPGAYTQEWIDARTSRVTLKDEIVLERKLDLAPGRVEVTIPFTVDNDMDNSFFDGAKNNFQPGLNAYVADTSMRVRVQASQSFSVKVGLVGTVEAFLIVERNGVGVANAEFVVSGPYNSTSTKTDILNLDELVDCAPGDQLTVRFEFGRRTRLANYEAYIALTPGETWASFTPDGQIRPGDRWLVARNLPDMNCLDLLKTVALMQCATYQVDEVRHTIKLIPLDDVRARVSDAVDWSDRVESGTLPLYTPSLSPYGKQNLLKWKALDKVSPYGDGVLESETLSTPATTPLFELPFAACLDSKTLLSGYGAPVQIITRTLSTSGGTPTVNVSATTPRLILMEPTVTRTIDVTTLDSNNLLSTAPVNLTGCWWGERPFSVVNPDNAVTLAFSPITIGQREKTLIVRRFQSLKRMLRRPRTLRLSMQLSPTDIAMLDLTRPVRIRNVDAGAMHLNDSVYYLNQIENYLPNQPCMVTLIPF